MDGLRIGENHLGKALYATRAFGAEERVGVVEGRVIDDPDYSSHYSIDLGGDFSLEPEPPFRFLNHNCAPNCELILAPHDEDDAGPPRVEVWTRKRIHAGDELTIDYAWPAEAAIPCGCGSRWCRGWIVARSQRKRLPAKTPEPTAAALRELSPATTATG